MHPSPPTLPLARWALICLALALIASTVAWGQSQTRSPRPDAYSAHLRIGPVEGLTTDWHFSPEASGVPLGSTVRFRVQDTRDYNVVWTGAREVERRGTWSIAEAHFEAPGTHVVGVRYLNQHKEEIEESSVFEVIDLALHPIRLTPIEMTAEPLVFDEADPNADSMRYFFQGSSIAQVRRPSADHYVTSVNRWMDVAVGVEPAAFAPLLEWRLDGVAQNDLGAALLLRVYTPREHRVSVGPLNVETAAALETYLVHITSHRNDDDLPDGIPITFDAVTEPPGYEDQITWMASTKYGHCTPLLGEGASFTTLFETTLGNEGRWLGVRADNSTVSEDGKGGLSGSWNGNLTTESNNLRLELILEMENGTVSGFWGTLGAMNVPLEEGNLNGTVVGSSVTLMLLPGSPTTLAGTLAADGTTLSGSVLDDGNPIGAFQVRRCMGPDLTVLRGGVDASPPFGFCRIRPEGIFVQVLNRGDLEAPATSIVVNLLRDGLLVDSDTDPSFGPVGKGVTFEGVADLPECCQNLDEVMIDVAPVPGECILFNNFRQSVCTTDLTILTISP